MAAQVAHLRGKLRLLAAASGRPMVQSIVEGAGATVESIFSVDNNGDKTKRKIVIRFQGEDLEKVTQALEEAGYELMESCEAVHGFGNAA